MDLDTLLCESETVADPPPGVLASGRAALDAATRASGPPVVAIDRVRRRRTRRLGVVAVGMAASVALALVVVPTVDLDGTGPGAVAGAAPVLLRAAAAAGEQPGGWPATAYWHSVSSYHQGAGPTHRREIWIGHHAIGVLEDDGVDRGVIALDVALFPAGSSGLSWDQLYALPTESHALERALRAGMGDQGPKVSDQDAELFGIVGDLLRESPAAPPLRKALWEMAARVPGVTLVGAVTDSAGRPGVAVERDGQRYVVDPSDGRLLEESEGGAGAPPPTTISTTARGSEPTPAASDGGVWVGTYLEQGPADTAPAATNTSDQMR